MTQPDPKESRLGLPPLPVRLLLGGILSLAVVLLVVALANLEGAPPPAVPTSPAPVATPDVSSPVEGIIISVDAADLTHVRGFTLRPSAGFAFDFRLGQLENATEFPPGHLAEHQATSSPVRVFFRLENGERVVYRLEDAAPGATPSAAPS